MLCLAIYFWPPLSGFFFFADFRDSGDNADYFFGCFLQFSAYLQFRWQKFHYLKRFREKTQFKKFQKIDISKKWKIGFRNEIEIVQGLKNVRSLIFLDSTWNNVGPKSSAEAETAKNYFLSFNIWPILHYLLDFGNHKLKKTVLDHHRDFGVRILGPHGI